jgi:hypothetical protein
MTDSDKERVMKRLATLIAVTIIALYTAAYGTSATEINNGSKLILKEGTDSLFCTNNYYDDVYCAYSEGGMAWYDDLVTTDHDCPAIAADSTNRRWIIARQPTIWYPYDHQDLYYLSGGDWIPVTLYSAGVNRTLGPASLDGAAFTTTSMVYAAFRVTGLTQHIVLAKSNGTTVAACTVMTRSSLGDPAISVEPYGSDSNRVHITWEANDSIRYAVCLDSRTSSSIGDVALLNIPLDCGTVQHPSINADRGRVVVAWAKGATPEIYACQRAPDGTQWYSKGNLSETSDASDWPTIAMCDTDVVVAWEEIGPDEEDNPDHDILGCRNFGSAFPIEDDATVTCFPHITLQPDDDDLYLHTFWSEPYWAVGHDKLNLNGGGRGQQSAASVPTAASPLLAACEPNPLRGHTRISYTVPVACNVDLRVCDAAGRTVRTLASGLQKAGAYAVSWDARDAGARQVPCGVYFYRLDTPGFVSMKQAVVTR